MTRGTLAVSLEPLNQGAVIIESDQQLPVTLHRRDNALWRLRPLPDRTGNADQTQSGTIVEYAYVIEQSDATVEPASREWEHVAGLFPDHSAADAAVEFAGRVGVPYVESPVTSNDIDEILSQLVFCFDPVTVDSEEQAYRERLGIPTETVMFTDDITGTVFSSTYDD